MVLVQDSILNTILFMYKCWMSCHDVTLSECALPDVNQCTPVYNHPDLLPTGCRFYMVLYRVLWNLRRGAVTIYTP